MHCVWLSKVCFVLPVQWPTEIWSHHGFQLLHLRKCRKFRFYMICNHTAWARKFPDSFPGQKKDVCVTASVSSRVIEMLRIIRVHCVSASSFLRRTPISFLHWGKDTGDKHHYGAPSTHWFSKSIPMIKPWLHLSINLFHVHRVKLASPVRQEK